MYDVLELIITICVLILAIATVVTFLMWGLYLLIRKLSWNEAWKKASKLITKITAIILLTTILSYLVYFFGWRMFGYSACKLTSSLSVIAVDQNEDELCFTISGFYKTQYLTGDYVYEINDDVLTIGFHTQSCLIFPNFNILEQTYIEHGPVVSIDVFAGDISNINRIYVNDGIGNGYCFVKEGNNWVAKRPE